MTKTRFAERMAGPISTSHVSFDEESRDLEYRIVMRIYGLVFLMAFLGFNPPFSAFWFFRLWSPHSFEGVTASSTVEM